MLISIIHTIVVASRIANGKFRLGEQKKNTHTTDNNKIRTDSMPERVP